MLAALAARPVLAGILFMLAGMFMFSVNDVLGKWLVATYTVGQVLLIRSVFALAALAPAAAREGREALANPPSPGLQALRVALSTAEVALFYWAVTYLPLADTVTFYSPARSTSRCSPCRCSVRSCRFAGSATSRSASSAW